VDQETFMPYPEMMVAPMREDLVRVGFQEMRTPDQVDAFLDGERRTVLVVVNSICGCAAGSMRPAVGLALQSAEARPEVLTTVFAGQELEATQRARDYFTGYPPSSPSVALLKNGELVYMLERHQIEGRSPHEIAEDLKAAFGEHCS
jgi:putative YphP/YqiW family bacilliredoxin